MGRSCHWRKRKSTFVSCTSKHSSAKDRQCLPTYKNNLPSVLGLSPPSRWDLRQFPSNFWWLGHFPSARGFTNSRRAQLICSERDNQLLAEFQGRCQERFQQTKASAESMVLCLVYRGENTAAYRRRQSGCVYWLTGQLQTANEKRGSGR